MESKVISLQREKLEELINELKDKLYQSYLHNGLDSPETIKISQELDVLLNLAGEIFGNRKI
ncbi:Spo0E family sporulation regulatory protein-aspartic acid phosphatase [Bacillus salacetis]|uniref:Spo0E family sporulation regulatory protein-aspartic acid phosphatase n=1 Tax=Bacillus salacetis TaxID=2315464 RepID=UPI003BA3C5C9